MSVLIRLTAFSLIAAFGIVTQPSLANTPLAKESRGGAELIAQNSNLLQSGFNLYQTEKFPEAVKVLEEAAAAFQTQKEPVNQALALNYLALAYRQLGQLPSANKAIADSLTLLQSNKSNSKEYLSTLARVYNTQGQLQLASGQAEKALNTWKQATDAYTKIGDDAGIVGSQINQAQAFQALGLYRRALISLMETKQTLEKQPDSQLKATGLLSLGNALRVVGFLDKKIPKVTQRQATQATPAETPQTPETRSRQQTQQTETTPETQQTEKLNSRQVLEQALAVARQVQALETVAQIQLGLGNTARAGQKPDEALGFYRQAANSSNVPLTQVQAQVNQLQLLVEQGKFSDAQTLVAQIQSKLDKLPPSRKSIYARINFAQSVSELTQKTGGNKNLQSLAQNSEAANSASLTEAAKMLATAVQQAKSLGDARSQSYALGTLGGLYEQTRQWETAQDLTQQALIIAENIEAPDIAYRWQWQLGRIFNARGNERGNNPGAIAAYTKAVTTLKSLRNDLVAINPEVQFTFRESVEPVYRELVGLLLQPEQPSQENLVQARDVIESLQLAELDNFFRQACLDTKPVNIEQVDTSAAVIYPIILPDRLEVILYLPKQPLRHYSTSVAQDKVEGVLQNLRKSVAEIPTDQQLANPTDFLPPAREVYNWLLRKVEPDLQRSRVKTLVFVLDGSMRNIPMATLNDGEQFLVEKYSIALTPGLQLLPPQPLERTQLKALLGGLSESRQGFEALPNVKNELDRIDSELPASSILLNENFTISNLRQSIKTSSSPVVHLATHGQFSSNADETFLLTWNERIDVNELGALLRSRNANEGSPIELLVLSACQTAEGDKRAALGLAGIAVRAGARSTLATLWSVNDETTNTVMTQFYEQYAKSPVTKAEALRSAQVSLLKDPDFKHPFFWAPYVLVGNWQ